MFFLSDQIQILLFCYRNHRCQWNDVNDDADAQIDSASSTDAEDSDNDVQIGKFLFVADKLFLLTSH